MRIGEALALEPGDLDFKGRFIHVQRGLSRMKIETPKNGKTRRVDMTRQIAEALKVIMAENTKKGLRLGMGGPPQYLFTNKEGKLMDPNKWRSRVFDKMLKKAGLRKMRVHDLRHTYATLRITKGDSILDVSNQLGHYSVNLTLDTYTHWLP
jgi:integrase